MTDGVGSQDIKLHFFLPHQKTAYSMHGVTCTGWHSHRMYTVVNWLVNEVNLLPLLVLRLGSMHWDQGSRPVGCTPRYLIQFIWKKSAHGFRHKTAQIYHPTAVFLSRNS